MEQRTRSREVTVAGGDILSKHEVVGGSAIVAHSDQMVDYHKKKVRKTDDVLNGTIPPSNLDWTIITRQPYIMHREYINSYILEFRGVFRGTSLPDPGFGDPLLLPARANPARAEQNDRLMLELLAKTNPLRPVLSVPVFIKELVDIGSMFHLAAKTFAGFLGGSYLNYRFGWLQFVSDLKVLAGITEALESRIAELQSLQKHGGLRRKVFLFSDGNSSEWQNMLAASTWGALSRANKRSHHQIKIWGSVRWTCSKDFSRELEQLGTINKAFRLLFDLEEIDPETAWNLIPFSWLADYFIGLGDYLAANAGGVEVVPHDICIMRTFTAVDTYTPIQPGGNTLRYEGQAKFKRLYRGRDVVTNTGQFPKVFTELLTWSQWKVVLALFGAFRR